MQFGLAVHPEYTLLGHEVGGDIDTVGGIVLTALADAVYEHEGTVQLLEIKTEKAWASTGRRKDAAAAGRSTFAKLAHMEQMKVQQIVLAGRGLFHVDHGWVVYWEKNDGQIDQQPVDLDDPALLEAVGERLNAREQAWSRYIWHDELPARLTTFPDKGLCKPRSDTDGRGMYCPYRQHCVRASA
jgi:hypothetical protein